MLKTIFLFSLLSNVACQQIALKWKDPIPYVEIGNSAENPFGFYKGMIPFPPDDPDRFNVVLKFTNLQNKYIKIWAETVEKDASICLKDSDYGPMACKQGMLVTCYAPSQTELLFEFYCAGESCQTSDVWFWYRFKVSEAAANDQWCADQVDEYPSDFQPLPDNLPSSVITPPPPNNNNQLGNNSNLIQSTLMMVLATLGATSDLQPLPDNLPSPVVTPPRPNNNNQLGNNSYLIQPTLMMVLATLVATFFL